MMYLHARAGKSERLEAEGWVSIEIDGKPFIFEPSKEGVLDLMSLLRDYGYGTRILAQYYIVAHNPGILTEEDIQTLGRYWGDRLTVVTPNILRTWNQTNSTSC
jgi:hypothetical protein